MALALYGAAWAAILLSFRYRMRLDIRKVWRGMTPAEREQVISVDPEAHELDRAA